MYFFQQKNMFSTTFWKKIFSEAGRMQSPARGLKSCGARVRAAGVILAHLASRATFHGYF